MNAKTINSLPSPEDIYQSVLPNGITVLARANFNSPAVNISGYLSGGSIFETDEKLGLAGFVSSMLMRGTQRYTFDSIYNELETVGASLGFNSGVHNASFGGRSLVEDLPLLLNLLAEALFHPTFPKAEMERLRAQILTGLALREQDTSDMADMLFERHLYPDHPYGKPTDGYVETIQSITRKDLAAFHRLNYGPRGMVVGIVGAIQPKKAVEAVAKALGGWSVSGQKEPPALPPLKPLRKMIRKHHRIEGKSQSDLVVGTFAPYRKSPDFMAVSLANSVLGQFGMMGRIGHVVREKSGLAYYAYSSLNAGAGPGSWEVSAGVNPKNLNKALELIDAELRRFVKSGVTKQELADSQANYIGRLPLSFESNGGMVSAILNIHRHQLGMDYYQRYEGLVRSVTRDDVVEAARRYINPDRMIVATAGP
ncbi:MAG: insulinase family protein [Anaerolineales bacterium]|nr:insulinase family protein [Anaerolineales bacterium]MCB9146864.1 insulinase family protein [Anaerolineales bacterium]